MNTDDKTLAQLAEMFDCSKETMRRRIEKLPTDCRYMDKGRNGKLTHFVTLRGVELLRAEPPSRYQRGTKCGTNLVSTLERQLEESQRENRRQHRHINQLTKALDQQQKLHALEVQKIQFLEDKQKQSAEEHEKLMSENEELRTEISDLKSRGLFARIFNR